MKPFAAPTMQDLGKAIVQAAEHDWRSDAGEHDRSKGGVLDRMFVASTWSRFGVTRDPDAKVPDWCGMAVNWWQMRAGRNPQYAQSFLHCLNVEAFHTYGRQRNVNPKRLRTQVRAEGSDVWMDLADWHRAKGQLRMWTPRAAITDLVKRGAAQTLFQPGDTLLIDWHGRNDADHIALVRAWDGSRWLECIEGNRTGIGGDGTRRRDAVVLCRYDLQNPTVLRTMYGVGRLSLLDFNDFEVR
jgi:hypothetical protein